MSRLTNPVYTAQVPHYLAQHEAFAAERSGDPDWLVALRGPDHALIVITHYQRLLDYIVPDRVHVISDGRIALSGGKELALELDKKGYSWLEKAPVPEAATAG